jgi:hypothetical protein
MNVEYEVGGVRHEDAIQQEGQQQLGQQAFVTTCPLFFTNPSELEACYEVEHEVGSVWHQDTVQQEGRSQLGQQAFVTTCPLFFTNPSELEACDER